MTQEPLPDDAIVTAIQRALPGIVKLVLAELGNSSPQDDGKIRQKPRPNQAQPPPKGVMQIHIENFETHVNIQGFTATIDLQGLLFKLISFVPSWLLLKLQLQLAGRQAQGTARDRLGAWWKKIKASLKRFNEGGKQNEGPNRTRS